MLKIKNLVKRFPDVVAVDHLTIDIPTGITGLVGHNGAGKSTLFRLISHVYNADFGSITFDDVKYDTVEGKKKVFFLSDSPLYSSNGTCKEVMELYDAYFEIDKDKFNQLIEDFSLPLNRRVGNFSKGMRRQLFIAIALSSKCEYLLLDEAFDGLDPLVLETIKQQILKMKDDNRTIIISSHNIHALEGLCDRLVILYKGKLGKQSDMNDMANSFNKYQAMFPNEVNENDLKNLGLKVVSFTKQGSICHFVIMGEDKYSFIKDNLHPTLLENVSVSPQEIVALEMAIAKKEMQ